MKSVPIGELEQLPLLMLYAINATETKSLNEVHLQKIMFQTMKVLKCDPKDVGYRAHLYGPYSDCINEEKKELVSLGFLVKKNDRIAIPEHAKKDISKIEPPSEEIGFRIETIAKDFSKLENSELFLVTYHDDIVTSNGKYVENSEIKEEVIRSRIPVATGMYRAKKISLEKASELAGMGVRDFKSMLIEKYGAEYVD